MLQQGMETHAVSAAALESSAKKRKQCPSELIEQAVMEARHIGGQAATMKVNRNLARNEEVNEDTVRKWLSRWKKEGPFWENSRKRGRKSIADLTPSTMLQSWEEQVEGLRVQGESVTGRMAAAVGRAVLDEQAPSLLQRQGGNIQMSVRTGRRLLASSDRAWRKKSSSRIVPPVERLADTCSAFFSEISAVTEHCTLTPELVLNFDQTMHLYHPSRGFTWEKKGSTRVQVAESKDGFTFLPVVSMAGVVGAQLIFAGTTSAVFPNVPPGSVLHYAATPSHWSNEQTTLDLWRSIIIPYINRQRVSMNDAAAPVLVLADSYGAHWTQAAKDLVESVNNVSYISVPDSLTRIFQPLDLGIIAAMKNSILRQKDEFIEQEVAIALRE